MLYRCLFVLACAGAVSAQTLENTVQPMLTRTCAPCHNEEAASSHGRDAAARHPCATCHMQTVAATETAFLKAGGHTFQMGMTSDGDPAPAESAFRAAAPGCEGERRPDDRFQVDKQQLQAAFNWSFVKEDKSLGVHNTAYAVGLLKASIKDLKGK
jgi:hypothetical protein